MDSVAAIVKGAVTAGITERVITSRVARRHYLMATLQPFKEGHHPEQYRVPSLDGKDRCKYTRQIFVQKGQRVKNGEPVKVSFFRQVAPGATLMYEDILYACDEDVCPEYTKDPRKHLVPKNCRNPFLINMVQASGKLSPLHQISLERISRRILSVWILHKGHFTVGHPGFQTLNPYLVIAKTKLILQLQAFTSTSSLLLMAVNSMLSSYAKARLWADALQDSGERVYTKLEI